jgi:hypothetical protein
MIYGYLQVLADPNIDDTLQLVRNLLVAHEPQAARLLEAILASSDLAKQFPDAKLTPGSALFDDLVPVVDQVLAEPGLAEDVIKSLEDPAVRPLAARMRELMSYKDLIDYNPDTQAVVGTLHTPVDRTQPDSGFNRSVWQRILHLINDTSGVKLCNKQGALVKLAGFPISLPYDACNLLEIDDLAIFYVQSIAYAKDSSGNVQYDGQGRPLPKAYLNLNYPGYASLIPDSLLESQSTIQGFRHHPTPEALNRVLFLQPTPDFLASTMDPPVCKDGDRYIDQHTSSLQALELNNTYDALRPLVQPFADHNREDLFVKIMVVLHSHWPSVNSLQHQRTNPSGHGYAKESDIHAYEPLIASIIDAGALWPAITEGQAIVDAITVPSGKKAPTVLANAARYVFYPLPGLKRRDGATTTMTEDGHPVPTLSPWYVLADAYKTKKALIAAAGSEGQLWQSAISGVLDVLARGELPSGGPWRFKNPRFRGEQAALIDFLEARVAAHRAAADLSTWLQTDLPNRTAELLSGPVFAGAADFSLALSGAPDARAALEQLNVFLTSDGSDASTISVTVAADLLQWFADDPDLVPIAHTAGKALDPGLGLVDSQIDFVQGARKADLNGTIPTLLAKLEADFVPGRTPLSIIDDSVLQVNRVHPFVEQGDLSPADYVQAFQTVGAFLVDAERGLMKFVNVVKDRHVVQ